MNLKGKKFENARLGMEIYVYEIDGKEWFIGKDVAKILGYTNVSTAVSENVKKSQKKKIYVKTIENIGISEIPNSEIIVVNNNLSFITEIGLYQLVMKSRRKEAEEFQDWVYGEVLPSIRKNNFYVDRDYISKEQYQRLKDMLLIFCENGKIGLPRASEKIFGNKTELNERLMNMGLIDREKCWYDENFKCVDKDSGKIYPIFVCDVKGKYRDGEVSNTLQVSLTNHGFVYLHEMFKNNMNLGLN